VVQREGGSTSDAASNGATSPTTPGWAASGATDAARDGVVSAFVLGWHVTELFHARVPRSRRPRQVSADKLPGIGELDPLSRAGLLLAQVQADLHRVWRFDDTGQQPPDPGPIKSLLQADARQQGQLQHGVLQLHRQLLVALTAADFRLGKAYGLGRALAETVLRPDAKDPASYQRAFARYRLANLLGSLADLKSAFPPHAAEAVRGSLDAWAGWVDAPSLRPAVDDDRPASQAAVDGQAPGTTWTRPPTPQLQLRRMLSKFRFATQSPGPQARPVDWGSAPDRQSVTRALHRQGELWRAILSDEKDCLDFLSTDNYLRAADQLLGRIRHLTLRFVRHFWITSTLAAMILVGAIIAVFLVHATSTVVAVVVAGAGAVGVTWKGAASSLGRVLAQAQRPLWEGELDAAVANAVTWLPRRWRSAGRPAGPDGADDAAEVAAEESEVAVDARRSEELQG
jgi:hypothetical protein